MTETQSTTEPPRLGRQLTVHHIEHNFHVHSVQIRYSVPHPDDLANSWLGCGSTWAIANHRAFQSFFNFRDYTNPDKPHRENP